MTQNPPWEETLHDVLAELVRLLIVLDACPEQASTAHLEYLSRQTMCYSTAVSNDLVDVVAALENVVVSCTDLREKNQMAPQCFDHPLCVGAEGDVC